MSSRMSAGGHVGLSSSGRLEAAERLSRFGWWEWDLTTNRQWWSDNLYRLFGLEPSAVEPTFDAFLSVVHPDDHGIVTAAGQKALEGREASGHTFRIVRPDGEVRTLAGVGEAVRATDGTVIGIFGISQDVTERAAADESLRESEERYRALIEHAPEAIVVLDAETGTFDHVNDNACRLFGLARPELLEKGPIELSPPKQADGRPSSEAALAYIAAAIGGQTPVFEWRHRRADGSVIPCEIRLVRLPSRDRVLVRGSVTDITERLATRQAIERAAVERELAARSRKLQRVTDAALSSLSLDELLPELVARAREVLEVDHAAVLLADDRGSLELRAADGLEANTAIRVAIGEGFAGRVAAQRAAMTATGENLAIGEDAVLRASRSLLGVPLVVQDRVIGVLRVGSTLPRAFTEEDEQLLRLAGDRVALAVEHAQLYERERDTADALQRSLLPERLPDIPGAALAVRYRPAHYQVGGDFYDVFELNNGGWLMVLGDVCGKGPNAAAVTALARYTLRAEAQHQPRPAALLSALNSALLRQRPDGPYLTAIVAHLLAAPERLIVTVSAGGHPAPIAIDRTGRAREIAAHGPLLGLDHEVTFSDTVARLENSETLLLYTDGVLEAHAPARTLTEQDVLNALAGTTALAPRAILDLVERMAGIDAPYMPVRDDIAILALQALGQTEARQQAAAERHLFVPGPR